MACEERPVSINLFARKREELQLSQKTPSQKMARILQDDILVEIDGLRIGALEM